jgi:hypothetical protein
MHNDNPDNKSNITHNGDIEDTTLSLLLFPSVEENPHDDGHKKQSASTRSIILVGLRHVITTLSSVSNNNNKSSSKKKLFLLLFLTLIMTVFVIEKMVFAVRYVTMGRPAFLYGSPMNWTVVRGCLSNHYKQEIREKQQQQQQRRQHLHLPYDASSSTSSSLDSLYNPNIVWTWYRYNETTETTATTTTTKTTTNASIHSRTPKRRLLIAQYSGFGSYSKILNEVAPINQAYARRWGHDYVTLEGTALKFPGLLYRNDEHQEQETGQHDSHHAACPNMDNGYEAQSTFNKIPLLFKALEEQQQHLSRSYDQVLILDTDTMIVDLDYDITTLLLKGNYDADDDDDTAASAGDDEKRSNSEHHKNDANEYFLVAYRVWRTDWKWSWDVNAGITLWNLHHPSTRKVAEKWLEGSITHPKDVLLKNDDQFFLQRALMSLGWWNRMGAMRTVRAELEYYDATLIKHFKRDARSWTRTSLEQRLLRIQEAKAQVCQQWPQDCKNIQEKEENGSDNHDD